MFKQSNACDQGCKYKVSSRCQSGVLVGKGKVLSEKAQVQNRGFKLYLHRAGLYGAGDLRVVLAAVSRSLYYEKCPNFGYGAS